MPLAAAAAFLLMGAAPSPPPWSTLFGGPFELTDHRGRTVTDRSFRGRFMLIYFGYTHCPDLCPTNLLAMTEALEAIGPGPAARIRPLFVTVDPVRDTADVLGEYMGHFHPSFLGLRGDGIRTRRILKAYRVHRRKVVGRDAPPDDYLIDHATLTYLVGPDGSFLTLFPHDTTADRMAAALLRHLGGDAP